MTRSAAFAVALFTLAACDSGTADETDDLLGTWTFVSVKSQSVATVSRTQSIIDLTRAAEGSFVLSNAESGSLSFVQSYYSYGDQSQLYVSSFDQNTGVYPSVRQTLVLNQYADARSISLARESDGEGYEYYANDAPGAGVTSNGPKYVLNTDLTSYYSSTTKQTHVAGTLTLGSRMLTANEPSVLSEYQYDFSPGNTARYSFEPKGVLKSQRVSGNQTVEIVGTWTRTGDRVVLSNTEEGVKTSYEYTIRREGATLLLVDDQQEYPCDSDCLRGAEQQFGIAAGTLTLLKTEDTLQLVPYSGMAARAQVAPVPGLSLPAPLEARITVRPRTAR